MNKYVDGVLEYFTNRVTGIAKFKDYVKGIKIDAFPNETYGADYYRIVFNVRLNDTINQMEPRLRKEIDMLFPSESSRSGHAFVSFLLDKQNDRTNWFKRMKEFYDLYNLLGLFVGKLIMQLLPNVSFKIGSLNKYEEFNYLIKYWNDLEFSEDTYFEFYNRKYYRDLYQFSDLLKANDTSGFAPEAPGLLVLTDWDIADFLGIPITRIRQVALDNEIPLSIEGNMTIDIVKIDGNALKEKLEKNTFSGLDDIYLTALFRLIAGEEAKMSEGVKTAKELADKFPIKPEDIVLLSDEEDIWEVDIVEMQKFGIKISASKVNKKLDKGKIKQEFYVEYVRKHLSKQDYLELLCKFNWSDKVQVIRHLKRKPVFKNPLKKFYLRSTFILRKQYSQYYSTLSPASFTTD